MTVSWLLCLPMNALTSRDITRLSSRSLRSLAAVFPRLGLMVVGAQQVSALLEMCADETAARRHSRRAVAVRADHASCGGPG